MSDRFQETEREGGECPSCGTPATWRECCECDEAAWVIDCGHYAQPRPLAAGRVDGSEAHRTFCEAHAEPFADPGKVDVRPTLANCKDCGAEHDVDTMTLLAGDVDTYLCNACENERERPKYINVYKVTRHYGGPEEGGWWYDAGAPLASVPIMDGMDTEATREQLAAHFAGEACGDIGSVLGGAEVHVTLEPHMATSYPATRPHYE